MTTRRAFRDRVAEFFKAKPLVWIPAIELESIGGRQAWRTRVSECRTDYGMDIRNRTRRQRDAQGRTWTLSEYCYVPEPSPAPDPPAGAHDLNGWSLR